MSTLTGQRIKDTYDGLLKTTDSTQGLPVTGQTTIEDGLGNDSSIAIGRTNNGLSVTGDVDTTGDVNINGELQVDQAANFDGVITGFDNLNVQGDADLGTLKIGQQAPVINDILTSTEDVFDNLNDTSLVTTAAAKQFTDGIRFTETSDGYRPKDIFLETKNYGGGVNANQYRFSQFGRFETPQLRVRDDFDSYADQNTFTGGIWHRGQVANFCQFFGTDTQRSFVNIGTANGVGSNTQRALIQGNNNVISGNSDNSFCSGQGNVIDDAPASGVIGQGNRIDGTNVTETTTRSHAVGYNNEIYGYSSQAVGGFNEINTPQNGFAAGYNNVLYGSDNVFAIGESNTCGQLNNGVGVFAFGNSLEARNGEMAIGYRNDRTAYPEQDNNNGLAEVKIAFATGAANEHNALLITEGGRNGGSTGNVPQVARIIIQHSTKC